MNLLEPIDLRLQILLLPDSHDPVFMLLLQLVLQSLDLLVVSGSDVVQLVFLFAHFATMLLAKAAQGGLQLGFALLQELYLAC